MKQKIKILHLEDMPDDAELIDMVLKRGKINHETFVVPDKSGFAKAIKNFSYDIILSDHSLASFDSTEALRMVKRAGITVPFILVTATMSDEFAASIIKAGADDYIIKDRLSRLPSSIISSIEKHRLKAENDARKNKADAENKRLAARLQLATNGVGIGIWDWDIKKDELIWDDGMYRLYDIEDFQFDSAYEGWISRLHPEDMHRVRQDIQMALSGLGKYDTEFRVIWRDGSIHTIKAKGIVELDVSGIPERMLGVNWDISLQKLTEEKLLKSEAKLKEAQAIAHLGNFEINMIDYSEEWSDQMYEILGVKKTGVHPDERFSKYIHPDDLAAATDAFYTQLDSSMDYRIIRKDGVLRYVSSEWKFELDDKGKGVRVYGVMQDITQRKQGEIDRKNLVNSLLLRNAELEQFAYVASHDLQEPLRMITSFMTQLEKKYSAVVDEKGRQYIFFAVDGARRMRQIILDLLDFSRVGTTEDDLELVDFDELINETLALYRRQIEDVKARVTFKNLPTIKTFKSPLRQVFQNLIDNSLKYHKAGTAPVINIGYIETKTHFQFSVSDNGIGIAPEYAEKIFIIFQRLHNKDEYSGTGMGLAIVKKIIEGLGGKIWVESEEGKGATFYFTMMKTPNL